MKTKLTLAVLLAAFFSTVAAAQTNIPVQFFWDPSPAVGVNGYYVYGSQNPSFTNNLVGAGVNRTFAGTNLSATITVAPGTRWYFTATCTVNGFLNESLPSNVVTYTAPASTPPPNPSNARLTFVFPPGTTVTSTNNSFTITFP